MLVPRKQVLTFLEGRGKGGQATSAAVELPDTVDTERDAELLEKFGVDPVQLAGTFEGGTPDL